MKTKLLRKVRRKVNVYYDKHKKCFIVEYGKNIQTFVLDREELKLIEFYRKKGSFDLAERAMKREYKRYQKFAIDFARDAIISMATDDYTYKLKKVYGNTNL